MGGETVGGTWDLLGGLACESERDARDEGVFGLGPVHGPTAFSRSQEQVLGGGEEDVVTVEQHPDVGLPAFAGPPQLDSGDHFP